MEQTQTTVTEHSRTYTWHDPRAFLAAFGLSGIEVFQAMERGELPPPPIAALIDVDQMSFGEGTATFSLVPHEMHYNPIGTVHGGVIATLLDSACGCAVHTLLPPGEAYTSLDLTTKYLRPITSATGRITATATVLSRGARTALAEAKLTDSEGRLLAHATSSCIILQAAPPAA